MKQNTHNQSPFELILDKLSKANLDKRTKGSIFEKLSKHLLQEKDTDENYKEIFLWQEWDKKDGADSGIDLIIQTKDDEFIAVQCKFYEKNKLDLAHLSSYLSKLQSGVEDIKFSKGILIYTSDLTSTAQKQISQISKSIPIDSITLEDFIDSNINWQDFNPSSQDLPLCQKKKPRAHQIAAIEATKDYFKNPLNTRGKLIMACGTGKTFTSLKLIEELTPKNSIILFLAPSIALVGQTFREYRKEKTDDFTAAIICSDSQASKGDESDDIGILELPLAPSTNVMDIKKAYERAKTHNNRFIIFSTYQSIERIKEAQNLGFLNEISLMICDEAHRSVGKLYSSKEKDKVNIFTMCHSDENIKAQKRIYMSATPRIYTQAQKNKATDSDNEVFSMDDEEIFGKEIYSINFRQAVEAGLLSDYKVIILAQRQEANAKIANNVIARLKEQKINVDLEFVSKIIGTYKGLARKDLTALDEHNQVDKDFIEEMDTNTSKRVINFCRSIKASKNIKDSFQTIMQIYDEELKNEVNFHIKIDHCDGSMNAKERLEKLNKLNNPAPNSCQIVSNARCLSEGIDVPALDSVVFFDGRSSMVDIIQAVGRVMRKSPHKKLGYIILPLSLSENELSNLDEAVKNTNFLSIWNVLKALRSHDDSLVDEAVFKEKIKVAISDSRGNSNTKGTSTDTKGEKIQEPSLFLELEKLQELATKLYNVIPSKLGDKGYWASFTAKTAKIVERLNARLDEIFTSQPEILEQFLSALHANIHPNIKEAEAKEMIASHIITSPIFEILFKDTMKTNPIRKALDSISEKLHSLGLDTEETHSLNALYKNVEENVKLAKSQKAKQELIKNLYDTFFNVAFKKQAERLGIVYTPIEVVDFILHSTNALLKRHFQTNFNDKKVKIFDPFTGTGSFITRLLSKENVLIDDENFKEIFENGIFAQDIVLLAYYIALINITQVGQSRLETLEFENIALADSLDYLDNKKQDFGLFSKEDLYEDLQENKSKKDFIAEQKIKVIIGNPPYSGGANSQNDNNFNLSHPELEKRVRETYGKDSRANISNTVRDTLTQAIRMASDRLESSGILGFVVNGSFIDSTSADGFRKCVAKEFSHIYLINLRGNQRTQGETSRKEGGKIFDSGSRASVAIVFFVKDEKHKPSKEATLKEAQILYYDIGDYLSREDKLNKLATFKSLESVPFEKITPNKKGDWINQRGDDFAKLLPLKSEKKEKGIFSLNATGMTTGCDAWVYNFSQKALLENMQKCIATYNKDLENFNHSEFLAQHKNVKKADLYKFLNDSHITTDKTQIAWTRGLKKDLINDIYIYIYIYGQCA